MMREQEPGHARSRTVFDAFTDNLVASALSEARARNEDALYVINTLTAQFDDVGYSAEERADELLRSANTATLQALQSDRPELVTAARIVDRTIEAYRRIDTDVSPVLRKRAKNLEANLKAEIKRQQDPREREVWEQGLAAIQESHQVIFTSSTQRRIGRKAVMSGSAAPDPKPVQVRKLNWTTKTATTAGVALTAIVAGGATAHAADNMPVNTPSNELKTSLVSPYEGDPRDVTAAANITKLVAPRAVVDVVDIEVGGPKTSTTQTQPGSKESAVTIGSPVAEVIDPPSQSEAVDKRDVPNVRTVTEIDDRQTDKPTEQDVEVPLGKAKIKQVPSRARVDDDTVIEDTQPVKRHEITASPRVYVPPAKDTPSEPSVPKKDKGEIPEKDKPETPAEPAPKTPEAPTAPAPETKPDTKKAPTAQDDYMQASQDMIDAGGAWANRGIAMQFFVDKGLSPTAAAAIVGNFMQEATPMIDSTIAQPHGLGRGIGQWSLGGRFDTDNLNLVAFAQSKGKPWTDYNTQLEFVWAELNGPYRHVLDRLHSAGRDRTAATTVVSSKYEGAGVPELQTRIGYTNQVADKFNIYYQAILDKRTAPAPAPAPLIGWPSTGPDAMKLFNQCDSRWGNILSPNGLRTCNIACGPTNVAMAVDILKPDLAITPKETIDYANANKLWFTPAGGAPDSGGVTFDAMIQLAGHWGVSGNEMARAKLKDFATYKQILKEGGVIIAAGSGPAPFVDPSIGAHFVMIRGVTSDGKFLVADPYPKTPDTNTVAWDADQMMNSIFGAVVLYTPDEIKPTSTTEKVLDDTQSESSKSDRGVVDAKDSTLVKTETYEVKTHVIDESAARKAVDRAKRAAAAAKAATEQAQREKNQ